MSKHLVPSIIILLISVVSYSQDKPPKGTTRMAVTVTDTTNLYNRISLLLYEKGFSIDNRDQGLGFIASSEKVVNDFCSMKVHILIKDSTVTITPFLATNISTGSGMFKTERSFETIKYGGMKGSGQRIAWEETMSIAAAFGTKFTYLKEPKK